jgi:signal transduction histidine kinase
MSSTIRRISAFAFAIVAAVLLTVSALAYRAVRRSEDANRSVAHTHQVLSALNNVLATMVDAETSTREYAGVRVSRHLELFEEAKGDLPARLDTLVSLTADNPTQHRRAIDLRDRAAETMRLLQEIVAFGQSKQLISLDLRDREKADMDAIRTTVAEMQSAEQGLLERRAATASAAAAATQALMSGVVLIAFCVLAVSFVLVDRRAVQLRHANVSLGDRVRERTARLEAALASEQTARADAERAHHDRARLLRAEQQAHAEADAANQSKDAFLARVSHELRTPLNALMGWTRMLRDGQLPSARMAHAIESVDRNAAMLKTLVEDLVEISRMTAGKFQLERRHLDIVAVVRESAALLEPAAAAKDIRIQLKIESEPITVDGDPTRLRQVFWNLVSNAIKFTPAKGRVGLRVLLCDGAVEIRVVDSGQGIAPEFLPHVFEPFSQADAGGQGLGLGLAIVNQLVEAHDGRITVTSSGEGAGSTFTVALPLVQVPESV